MAIGLIPAVHHAALGSPHVVAAILVQMTIGGEVWRLHAGAGRLRADGEVWIGVDDPGRTRVVEISAIDCPDPSAAAAVRLTLSGVDAALIAALRSGATVAEGAPSAIRFAVYNTETRRQIGTSAMLFGPAWASSPEFSNPRIGLRSISITLESRWSMRSFPPGGRVTDADQQRRYPGDSIFKQVGGGFDERWPR